MCLELMFFGAFNLEVLIKINRGSYNVTFVQKNKTMKQISLIVMFLSIVSYAQSDVISKYKKADSLVRAENFIDSYPILKELLPKANKKESLYSNVLWHLITATTELEESNRLNEKWDNSIKYGLDALIYIKKGKSFFVKDKLKNMEFWMYKNLVVSYFGSGQLKEAKKYMRILYDSYKKNELPKYCQINNYFNFSFFKWNGHNIWGYEWYPEMPENRFSSSFTKIVYYVYSCQVSQGCCFFSCLL